MPELSLAEIARRVAGTLSGDGERVVCGVAPLESAGPADLSFVAGPRYLPYLQRTRAAAVLIPEALAGTVADGPAHIRVADAHAALARILPLLYPEEEPEAGVHPTAFIAAEVELAEGVSIGPYAVIGRGARIGARTRIGAHTVVGERCSVGAECVLHAQVTLYPGVELGRRCIVHSGARLGTDGFGFVFSEGEHRKIPQIGGCRIGDDVEIGANSTIDRGSVGDTVVGSGTKIDNLVHLGHNVRVGRQVIIVAQTGVSGSTTIGDGAVLGGQAGIGGHLSIGPRARIGAQAGVMGNVGAGETVSGYPARPHREAMRAYAALFRLPDLLRRLREIERAVLGTEDSPAGPESNLQVEQSERG